MQEQRKKYMVIPAVSSLAGMVVGAGLLAVFIVYFQPFFLVRPLRLWLLNL